MKTHNVVLFAAVLGFILFIGLAAAPDKGAYAALSRGDLMSAQALPPADSATTARVSKQYGNIPLQFEANRGQTDQRVKFLSRGQGYSLFLTGKEAVLSLTARGMKGRMQPHPARNAVAEKNVSPPAVVRMSLTGSNPHSDIAGLEELPGRVNYFTGNDPARWRTNVPAYKKVCYQDVYPGIDLIYYGKQGSLEYDFVVNPGGDYKTIKMAFNGVDTLTIASGGDLLLHTPAGMVLLKKPVIYQKIDGLTREIDGSYLLQDKQEVSFRVARYDKTRPLIIDPILAYSTYLGGSGSDAGYEIAVDSSGSAYVTGETSSADFPVSGAYQGDLGDVDAFVTKFDPSGRTLAYSTYLGGGGTDIGYGIAVDSSGSAYVTGWTDSTDFPTQNPYHGSYGAGQYDAFVTKLDASGNALAYSTYLGGNSNDYGVAIAVDPSGYAYVTGETLSTNFPTANAYQVSHNGGGNDAFVTKLDQSGSALAYSTYLGGTDSELGYGIAVDSSGSAYVTGGTSSSTNFPSVNACQTWGGGYSDAFVTKFSPAGNTLAYSTFLGGSGKDLGYGIAVDSSGSAYVTGETLSTNFPTVNAFQGSKGETDPDAFVTKLSLSGNTLTVAYSTYLGGIDWDIGRGIAVDSTGNAYVTGDTSSIDFPTRIPCQRSYGGLDDAFVAKLDPSGSTLAYSTYLGGSAPDYSRGIAVDADGSAYVTGWTWSTDFPTRNAYQESNAGYADAFVTKIRAGNVIPGVLMLLLLTD